MKYIVTNNLIWLFQTFFMIYHQNISHKKSLSLMRLVMDPDMQFYCDNYEVYSETKRIDMN